MDQMEKKNFLEFAKLYKSAAESKIQPKKLFKKVKKINEGFQLKLDISEGARLPDKNKKTNTNEPLKVSHIKGIEHSSLKKTRSSEKNSSTSTPSNKGMDLDNGVKSIMKNKSSDLNSLLNVSNVSTSSSKPKKRNKSVSFMLGDEEEVVVKKSKSNDSSKRIKSVEKEIKNKNKTHKQNKNHQSKENDNKVKEPIPDIPINEDLLLEQKKKLKKAKKSKPEKENGVEISENNITEQQKLDNTSKKLKKKKRKIKSILVINTNADGEPPLKTRKKDLKPEVIAKGLENLNIGDNAHTLTNLLDEMTVVDKNKKKKDKKKLKSKKQNMTIKSEDNKEGAPQQNNKIEEKEKVKWNNRKWNKDAKGESKSRLRTSVVVENLPIKIMCSYKALLSEHFNKFGTIAGIGVAEAYPAEDPKPVFTTTVFFLEEKSATKALEEDNSAFEGNRIRVRRPQPPTETTLVVRAYGMSDQALSSLFSSAGRVRAIRQLIKGKKSIGTAFVEFDGPEAVDRALKLVEDVKINGKKMHVSKFEVRKKRKSILSEKNIFDGAENDD